MKIHVYGNVIYPSPVYAETPHGDVEKIHVVKLTLMSLILNHTCPIDNQKFKHKIFLNLSRTMSLSIL